MIPESTKRDIFDHLRVDQVNWAGRLDDVAFLERLYDLKNLPSTDNRFSDAAGDIWQHRINNWDWEEDWVYLDPRFDLLHGPDQTFLNFLCEIVHPVVRADAEESRRLVGLFNDLLNPVGWEITERASIGGRPVFAARRLDEYHQPSLKALKALETVGSDYIARQINRMETAIRHDPELAIGTAKELVETVCKTILQERKVEVERTLDVPQLVRATVKKLSLTPDDIPDAAKAAKKIRVLLSNLATVANGLAELRNAYGSGHGKPAESSGLKPRHARLAVGAASTLAVFLFETHKDRA